MFDSSNKLAPFLARSPLSVFPPSPYHHRPLLLGELMSCCSPFCCDLTPECGSIQLFLMLHPRKIFSPPLSVFPPFFEWVSRASPPPAPSYPIDLPDDTNLLSRIPVTFFPSTSVTLFTLPFPFPLTSHGRRLLVSFGQVVDSC